MEANHLPPVPPATLAEWVIDAGRRTLALVADRTDDQLLGPRLATINPPLWELGHLAWFTEKWLLRDAGRRPSLRADADALYDSAAVAHATRWDLPFPSRADTLDYVRRVREGVLEVLARGPSKCETYYTLLSVFHEDMHGEAFLYTWQTLGYPRPAQSRPLAPRPACGPLPGRLATSMPFSRARRRTRGEMTGRLPDGAGATARDRRCRRVDIEVP